MSDCFVHSWLFDDQAVKKEELIKLKHQLFTKLEIVTRFWKINPMKYLEPSSLLCCHSSICMQLLKNFWGFIIQTKTELTVMLICTVGSFISNVNI